MPSITAKRFDVHVVLIGATNPWTNFKAAQPLLGLILMADFAQGLDASKLILAETLLSFIISPYAAPPYNLPLFLFGLYVQESQEAAPRLLQVFAGYLGASALFDIIWFTQNQQAVIIRLISILVLLLKVPTLVAFSGTLSSRGISNINLSGADFGGATVWSMPGGFTSSERDGYQTVGSEAPRPAANQPPAGNPPPAPGAYQSV